MTSLATLLRELHRLPLSQVNAKADLKTFLLSSSTLSLLKIELLDLLACFLLLHGGFLSPHGSLPGRAESLAHRMSGTGGHGRASQAGRGPRAKDSSTRFKSWVEPQTRPSRWMASNHLQTMEEKTSMTSVLLASGVPEPRQAQGLTRTGRRQGGQTLAKGRAHLEPMPGPAVDSSHAAGWRGGRQPLSQVRS